MQIQLRAFVPDDTPGIVALWQACGLTRPWNDPYKDIERKLAEDPELLVVAEADRQVVGSAMVGYDGHRGWVYYLAVAPAMQKKGVGRALTQHAEALLLARGCPKVQLMIRQDNARVKDFYLAQGYEPAEVLVLGKRLIADD